MAMFYEKAMVPEHSSFSSDKSAKWITLFIGTKYSFKPEKLLEVLQGVVGQTCTVERVDDDPRYASSISSSSTRSAMQRTKASLSLSSYGQSLRPWKSAPGR